MDSTSFSSWEKKIHQVGIKPKIKYGMKINPARTIAFGVKSIGASYARLLPMQETFNHLANNNNDRTHTETPLSFWKLHSQILYVAIFFLFGSLCVCPGSFKKEVVSFSFTDFEKWEFLTWLSGDISKGTWNKLGIEVFKCVEFLREKNRGGIWVKFFCWSLVFRTDFLGIFCVLILVKRHSNCSFADPIALKKLWLRKSNWLGVEWMFLDSNANLINHPWMNRFTPQYN